MSLSSHSAASSVMARAGFPSAPASSASAADAAPFFPPDAAHLTEPDYSLPFPLASAMTAQAVCKQAQHSGIMERWIGEMEEAIRRDAAAAAPSAAPPGSDDPSAFESALLARLLQFVDTDPEIARLLRSVESSLLGAPASLHEIVKRVNGIVQRSVLAPPAGATTTTSATAAAAAAVSQLRGGHHHAASPSSSSASLLPDLHRACTAAFHAVDHAAPLASDPVHPACWLSDSGLTARGDAALRDARSDRVCSAAAEGFILALQNDAIDQSNAKHHRKTQAVRAMALREMAMQIRNAPSNAPAIGVTPASAAQLPSDTATAAALRQKRKASRGDASDPASSPSSALRDRGAHSDTPKVEWIDVTSSSERNKKARVDELA